MQGIYLDNAASTKIRAEIIEKMNELYADNYANASSLHKFGRNSKALIENSRINIAKNLNVDSKDIIFTSGATESNNIAIRAAISKDKEIICSSIEHSSISNLMKELANEGYTIKYINTLKNGQIDINHFKELLSDKTSFVCVMAVNNETGVIQPISEIGELIKGKNIHFHVDAVQLIGKKEINPYDLNISSMSISIHKIYGPKGIGILYYKDDMKYNKLMYGGEQEKGKRPGTENVQSIVLADMTLDIIMKNMKEENENISKLMSFLVSEIKTMDNIIINGDNRLDNIINIQIKNKNIQMLLPMLDMKGILVSGGSACMSGSINPSPVLVNMGLSEEEAMSSIRISLGIFNKIDEIQKLVETLRNIKK